MLLLLHALIPCVATYILSFGLHNHIIIVVCSPPCVAAYITCFSLPLFLYFLALSSLNPSTF